MKSALGVEYTVIEGVELIEERGEEVLVTAVSLIMLHVLGVVGGSRRGRA